jgi:hypothetical protein
LFLIAIGIEIHISIGFLQLLSEGGFIVVVTTATYVHAERNTRFLVFGRKENAMCRKKATLANKRRFVISLQVVLSEECTFWLLAIFCERGCTVNCVHECVGTGYMR